jgi:hypothetical protein
MESPNKLRCYAYTRKWGFHKKRWRSNIKERWVISQKEGEDRG